MWSWGSYFECFQVAVESFLLKPLRNLKMWSRILALLVWTQLWPFCQRLLSFFFFFPLPPNAFLYLSSSSTQVLYSHVFALFLVEKIMPTCNTHISPHLKEESFQLIAGTICITCDELSPPHPHPPFSSSSPLTEILAMLHPGHRAWKGKLSSHKHTHTWKDSHHKYTQHPYPPTHPRLHQDDSRPLSLRDKDSVSWDDVTAAFLMGVNLCLAEQQQKNLCVALNPHVLPRTRAASVLFCSSMWLSLLTFSPSLSFPPSFKAPLLFFSPYFNCLYFTLAVSITHFLHIFLLSEVCFFFFSFSVFFLSFPSLNICSSVSFLSLYFF